LLSQYVVCVKCVVQRGIAIPNNIAEGLLYRSLATLMNHIK